MGCPALGQLWVPLKIRQVGPVAGHQALETGGKPTLAELSCSLKGSWHQVPLTEDSGISLATPHPVPGISQGVGARERAGWVMGTP